MFDRVIVRLEKGSFLVLVIAICFLGAYECGIPACVRAQPIASIAHDYEAMHENMRYLELKRLALQKRRLEAAGYNSIDIEQVGAKMNMLINSLRTALFREYDKIFNFYKLRYELFYALLQKKEARYMLIKESRLPSDIFECDALFEHINLLEVKVVIIGRMLQRIERDLFVFEARSRFLALMEEYNIYKRQAESVRRIELKKEILLLVKEVAQRLEYPLTKIDMVDKKIKDTDALLNVYAYWDATSNRASREAVDVDEPEKRLSPKTWATAEMQGRRNYVDKIVNRSKDLRLTTALDDVHRTRNVKDDAFIDMENKYLKARLGKEKHGVKI